MISIFLSLGNLTFDTTVDDLKKFFEDTSKIQSLLLYFLLTLCRLRLFFYLFLLLMFKEPSSIRLISDKVTKKSKGFAFVEFIGSKYLEVSFKFNVSLFYFYSFFKTALSKDKCKIKGRKINIELTAGGGGSKSEIRKERIKSKNEKFKKEKQSESESGSGSGSKSISQYEKF